MLVYTLAVSDCVCKFWPANPANATVYQSCTHGWGLSAKWACFITLLTDELLLQGGRQPRHCHDLSFDYIYPVTLVTVYCITTLRCQTNHYIAVLKECMSSKASSGQISTGRLVVRSRRSTCVLQIHS